MRRYSFKQNQTRNRLKTIIACLSAFMSLIFSVIVNAQPQYMVGSATSGSDAPIPFATSSLKDWPMQLLYLPGEFGTVPSGLSISKIYFAPSTSGTCNITNMEINIGQTSITSLPSNAWVAGLSNGLTSSGYTMNVTANNWIEITLQNPIPYDPSKSLVVEIKKDNVSKSISLRYQSASGSRMALGTKNSSAPTYALGWRFNFGFDLVSLAPNNAGISEVTAPVTGFCPGTMPLKVRLENSGTKTLNSVTIQWALDNIPQPDINWNTPIAKDGNAEVVLSNNVTFGKGPRKIKVWTTMPNGAADGANFDDTLETEIRARLSGNYTVGTGGDFTTVKDAVDALNIYGVCGPVLMEILTGTYTGAINLNNITGANNGSRIIFKSKTGNTGDVIIAHNPQNSDYVFRMSNASYVTLKDITIKSTDNGRVLEFTGNPSYDSVVNCHIESDRATTASSTIYASGLNGTDNVFVNDTIIDGYIGVYWRGANSGSGKIDNTVFQGNVIKDAYARSAYLYYNNNLKFTNNIIEANTNSTHEALYCYYGDNDLEISGNKITVLGTGTKYGMRLYYNDGGATNRGKIFNNVIVINKANGTVYGMYCRYTSYQSYYNNSVSVNSSSTSGYAALFYFSSTSYHDNEILNNLFYNAGKSRAMYVYRTYANYNNAWDYNSLYAKTNSILIQRGSPSKTYADLATWRSDNNQGLHSITYHPGTMSNIDLHPDINDSASWSLNGRGVQIPGNNIDHDGNNRPGILVNGAPDIGAYEFTPQAIPPIADVTPQVALPGDTQTYSFGEQEVAKVVWGINQLTTDTLVVRQYSGEKAPGVASAASPNGSMYFYTTIESYKKNKHILYDVDLILDYNDTWLGDIGLEGNVRLAQQYDNYPWMVYGDKGSGVNVSDNRINTEYLSTFGTLTGLEKGSLKSALVRPQTKTLICIGNYVKLDGEPLTGTYYKWYLNGNPISGAEGAGYRTYTATQQGDYQVEVTYNNDIVRSVPVNVKTIAVPNAIVTSNAQLTYCIGKKLFLNAGNVPGLTYQWKFNGFDISGATDSTYQVTKAGQYSVAVKNIACESVSNPVLVSPGPLYVDLGKDTVYCEKKNNYMLLDAGYKGSKYKWSTGDTSQSIAVKSSGTYWVEVDAGQNCFDRDTVNVNIKPLPSANGISYTHSGNTYYFHPAGAINVDDYWWFFNDEDSVNQETVTKNLSGQLYVKLVLSNTCGNDTIQLGWPQSVNIITKTPEVTVFPNPASNKLVISVNGTKLNEVLILNSVGAIVYKGKAEGGQFVIDVSTLTNGHYVLKIATSEGLVSRKLDIIK